MALEHAGSIAAGVIAEDAPVVDRDGAWPARGIRALQAAGLAGLVLPESVGGHGHGLLSVAKICQVVGRVCPSTAISFGMHLVGSAVIAAKATPEQRRRYLEPIARGEHLTTLALSEPGTGSHFYIPETRIEPTDRGFVLNGQKSFVTNGSQVDSYVVSAVSAGASAQPGEFSCVVVRKESPGLSWGPQWAGWGMRGNSARNVTLSDVAIERSDLLGEEGDEIWYVFQIVAPFFLMAMAGTYLGVAEAALEVGRRHLLERTYSHTGASLAENGLLQHRLGILWAQVHRTRAFLEEAARLGDAGHADALPALCSSKAEVAETAERVTAEIMTLLGGRGYAAGSHVQQLYRDVRAAHIMSPTTDILRTWTGRAILGLPILGE
ncbi:acyl-CoA dehydrogenase family protein [Polyangium aurulentum]|uniref:acyl-CoA dehydrogenase family protein n=1 Tax=Polyangium aurulentum TaxID=2567896 RepID=UPI00197F4892|nr:acyl-CoA dehydrogenase family protein [Polyangium aurulentum]UQA61007.1 acyl-CoA/acyl-ACP dehydrogenase [Polyangium aurulentum]